MMNAATTLPVPEVSRKARIKKLIVTVILISVGVHLAVGVIAGFWIVAKYFSNPPAEFKVVKDIRIPAQQREHSMNMAAFDSMAPKPSFNDKMQSLRPTAFALPDLPKVPMDQMLPLDPSAIVSDAASSLVGSGGLGGGGAGMGGGGGTGDSFSFLGVQAKGKRILLVFDVSVSVVNKANKSSMPLSKIKEETIKMISNLPINSRFDLIQFTQNYKAFTPELVPATDPNKQAAQEWIAKEWEETGSMSKSNKKVVSNPRGFLGILEFAVKLQPDVIFVISDASFQAGGFKTIPWKDLRDIALGPLQTGEGCVINFIGFEMKPDDRKEASNLARRTQGRVQELK